MTILDTLNKDHDLLRGLLNRIERSLLFPEKDARLEVRNLLMVLFSALAGHEQIEDMVFQKDSFSDDSDAIGFLNEVERQHQKIKGLKKEIDQLLGYGQDFEFEHFKKLVGTLVDGLRLHFTTEETKLWPAFVRKVNRTVVRSLGHQATRRLHELEHEMKEREELIEDYLNPRKK